MTWRTWRMWRMWRMERLGRVGRLGGVLAVGIAAGCGGDAGPAVADDTADGAVADATVADAGDDADLADAGADVPLEDATVAVEVDVVATDATSALDVPGDRNCEYDPRYGNTRDAELRCRPCRSMVGIAGDKIQVVLLWWARYDVPLAVPDLCAGVPGECSAKVVEAEVLLCKNLGSSKTRLLWSDIAEVVRGSGADAEVGEARGPLTGVMLGDIRPQTASDVPYDGPAPAFVPAEWVVKAKAGDVQRVKVDVGRNPADCPVGKITLGGATIRLGVIEPCAKAFQAYGGE